MHHIIHAAIDVALTFAVIGFVIGSACTWAIGRLARRRRPS